MTEKGSAEFRDFHETSLGRIVRGDSIDVLASCEDASVDLIMTSPPFGLVRKKDYGNVEADEYVEWFRSFAVEFRRVIKDDGSLVIDIGGAWNKGRPTRNLYHFKLLIMLCEDLGFHLAQDFYWWNPSKLPTPAEWVTVRRIRVKDAINTVWWLSVTPWPKASNRRVLQPYSPSMQDLLAPRDTGPESVLPATRSARTSASTTVRRSRRICSPFRTPRATASICATASREA